MEQSQTTIETPTFLRIPQLCQDMPQVTYIIVTEQVRLLNAVYCQCPGQFAYPVQK